MNEERLRDLYTRGIAARDARGRAGSAEPEVTPDELQALVSGDLPEEERLALLDRVMSSERTRAEFELLRAVEMAGRRAAREESAAPAGGSGARHGDVEHGGAKVLPFDTRAGRPAPVRRRSSAWRTIAVPALLAATLMLAVGLQLGRDRGDPEGGDVLRGPAAGLVLISPPEEVGASDSLVFAWRPVAGATRYQLEILDAEGMPVRETTTTDTTVVFPRGLVSSGVEYRWLVRATDTSGAQLSSTVRRLRVRDQ